MMELNECPALKIGDEEVSLYDVMRIAKLTGQLQFIDDAIEATIIRQTAAQRGIEVSDEELQQAADDFRIARELQDTEATQSWLEANRLSWEDWELLLEDQLIADKVREMLTAGRVEQRFAEQGLSFDAAAISRLVLEDEGIARELRAQIIDDGADFHALARQYSIDVVTKLAGGYAGLVSRPELEPAVEAAVFGSEPGKIVGPIKSDDGWLLIKVESLHPAVLDDAMRETIMSLLFREWLSERRLNVRISIPLLEPSGAPYEEPEPLRKTGRLPPIESLRQ
jgi:putative peptide maturation system protein